MGKSTHNNKRKIILIGLGVLGSGVAGFLGWSFYKRKKRANQENEDALIETSTPNTNTAGNDNFPLKNGSKGAKVKQLQNALIKKYGASILPKYGADGMFGKETAAALVRAKLPATINETTFNSFVGVNILSGFLLSSPEIISTGNCEIFKVSDNSKIKVPKNVVLGKTEYVQSGWIYFSPKNSPEIFRVREDRVKHI